MNKVNLRREACDLQRALSAANRFGTVQSCRRVELGPGEIFVVPKGVEHRPVADEEVHLLLIEPTGTPNTGDPGTAAPRNVI